MSIIRQWLAGPLPADVRRAVERLSRCEDVAQVALMPDVHLSHDVCVGTVLATRGRLYPSAVGGDIGCGMAAVAFDAGAELLADARRAAQLFAELNRAVPANRQAKPAMLPTEVGSVPLSHPTLETIRRRDARVQLGTLGRGNHFLEFQADEESRLWLMLHTGSRALGQAIRDHHLAIATGRPIASFAADSVQGRAYIDDMGVALAYAQANRDAIITAVIGLMREHFHIEPVTDSRIDCHHNFVRAEEHGGEKLFVHRKGAIRAAGGEIGIIPGSMGSASFHVEGRGCAESLCSASHGAGRTMSRHAARVRVSPTDLAKEMRGVWYDARAAARICDEAPSVYKDIHAVMRAQRDLVKITRRLRPLLSYKG